MADIQGEESNLRNRGAINRRLKRMGAFVAAVMVLLALGFVAGWNVKSPADRKVTEFERPVRVIVPTEVRRLQEVMDIGCDVSNQRQVVVKSGGGEPPVASVVTGSPVKVGDKIKGGTVVAEISGRPRIALRAGFPFYRDIKSGDSGPDVAQLVRGLASLGYDPGETDRYDTSVSQALGHLYDDRGYAPPSPDPESQAALAAAQSAIDAARTNPEISEADWNAFQDEAAAARSAALPPFHQAEFVVMPFETMTVAAVAPPGTELEASASALTLDSSELLVRCKATVTESNRLAVGSKASLAVIGSGVTTEGTLLEIGDFQSGQNKNDASADEGQAPSDGEESPAPLGVDGAGYELALSPADSSVLTAGGQVTARFPVGELADAGPVVPLTAIREQQLETYVETVDGDRTIRVPVKILASADGYVRVNPVRGELKKGTPVLIAP